jgi:hypothetical protein
VTDRVLYTPTPTGRPWLLRAVAVSGVLHALALAVLLWTLRPPAPPAKVVDIELAPPPPPVEALPEEVARAPAPATASAAPEPAPAPAPVADDEPAAPPDAAVDAPRDAAFDAPRDAAIDAPRDAAFDAPRDAAVDAPRDAAFDAPRDAAVDAPRDAATDAPRVDAREHIAVRSATGSGSDTATGSDTDSVTATATGSDTDSVTATATGSDTDSITATATGSGSSRKTASASASASGSVSASVSASASASGSGSGSATAPGTATESLPAVPGAPTTPGTAANLLAYFPPGHVLTALVRFDRLRGTEWAEQAQHVLEPLPDYRLLFGARDAKLGDALDLLVISSPRPRDATATTLVIQTAMSRALIRAFLASPGAPFRWSAARGGMLGRRKNPQFAGDVRVLLCPWRAWCVLAPAPDFGGLTAPARGNIDALEATAPLPAWLDGLRAIRQESGDGPAGPALVVTIASRLNAPPGPARRAAFPDVGLGVTSLPIPERVSAALELVARGWQVRGNLLFATERDAAEFVASVTAARKRLADSLVLGALLRRQHVFNLATGLSLARAGVRVSYATSISIADARALLAAIAAEVDQYFRQREPIGSGAPARHP